MKTTKLLSGTVLFKEIIEEDIRKLLENADSYIREFQKGENIYPPESPISHAGIILSGEVDVLHTSIHGYEEIVGRDTIGDLIGPAFCITGMLNDLTQFRVRSTTKVLFLNINKMLNSPSYDNYYTIFIRNLTNILASNNIVLNRKIRLLTRKSLREKLLVYFTHLSNISCSKCFELPFTREQLAQYVCSERSSLCRELGKMQDDGLIKVSGNIITLLDKSDIYV